MKLIRQTLKQRTTNLSFLSTGSCFTVPSKEFDNDSQIYQRTNINSNRGSGEVTCVNLENGYGHVFDEDDEVVIVHISATARIPSSPVV